MAEKISQLDITSNEKNDESKQTNEHFEHVCDFFSPIREQWPLIQDVLLWKKVEISTIVFNILNVLFWIFLTPRLQLIVSLSILLSLLWLTPPIRHWLTSNIQPSKLSAKGAESVDSDDPCEVLSGGEEIKSSQKKMTSYEDFCHGVAVIWGFLTKYWIKLKNLKEENTQKFYAVLVLLVVILAVVCTRFPVGNIVYLTVMSLYLWPAIVYYGVKDVFVWKLQKLFRPFFTQWQSSRTKRKRNTVLQECQKFSDISDDEDFTLNTTETEKIHSSVISPDETAKQKQLHVASPLDSVDSSLTFVEGLEFPSMTRTDSVESFNSDDFVEGLNFKNTSPVTGSHHSSMDSLIGENDETVQWEKNYNLHPTLSEGYTHPEQETMMGIRSREQPSPDVPPSRNKSLDDLQSYEVVEASEIEAESNKDDQQTQDNSYIASGTKYMGKLFGYP